MLDKFCTTAAVAALLMLSSFATPLLKQQSSLVEDQQIRLISEVLFDYTTHVLQTAKVTAAMNDGVSPMFGIGRVWSLDYTKQVCSANNTDCQDVHEQMKLGGTGSEEFPTTYLLGMLGKSANVAFGRNNFTYTFTAENLALMSSDYQRISTKLSSGNQYIYSGLELSITSSSVGLSGDFEFSEGAFKVSNLRVLLDLGRVAMIIPEVVKFENGTWTDLEPIEKDAAAQVMELWRSTDENGVALETRYSRFIEEKINDFLAGRLTI